MIQEPCLSIVEAYNNQRLVMQDCIFHAVDVLLRGGRWIFSKGAAVGDLAEISPRRQATVIDYSLVYTPQSEVRHSRCIIFPLYHFDTGWTRSLIKCDPTV